MRWLDAQSVQVSGRIDPQGINVFFGLDDTDDVDPGEGGSFCQSSANPTAQETNRILLIGEGNFSFARALILHSSLRHLPAVNLTATAYDSEEECFEKYPEAREIVQGLKERGVEVLFNVDATALEKCKALKGRRWNRVAWNFPHAGEWTADIVMITFSPMFF